MQNRTIQPFLAASALVLCTPLAALPKPKPQSPSVIEHNVSGLLATPWALRKVGGKDRGKIKIFDKEPTYEKDGTPIGGTELRYDKDTFKMVKGTTKYWMIVYAKNTNVDVHLDFYQGDPDKVKASASLDVTGRIIWSSLLNQAIKWSSSNKAKATCKPDQFQDEAATFITLN